MPIYEISGKYTAAAHAAVRQAGYASREAAGRKLVEEMGGKLLSWYWVMSPERDFFAICELPNSDALFAMASVGDSSGAFVRSYGVELRTSEQAQAAIAQETSWRPPTSS